MLFLNISRFLNINLRKIENIIQKRYVSSSIFLYHDTYLDDCITIYCNTWCIISPILIAFHGVPSAGSQQVTKCSVPSHYLNHWYLNVSFLRNKPHWNINENEYYFFQENTFFDCKISVICPCRDEAKKTEIGWEYREGGKTTSVKRPVKKCVSLLWAEKHIDGLVQDRSNSIASAMELLQSSTKHSI